MSLLVQSEKVTVLSALETTLGTQPTSGWRQHEPNPNGIVNFRKNLKKVARSPLSKNRQFEKGDIVDLDATVQITQDYNKDLLERFAEGVFLAKEKHNGGTGVARFMVTPDGAGAVGLTAITSSALTVVSGGALPQGTLVYLRGFALNADGIYVVGAASTGTSITLAGVTAEPAPPVNAMAEVMGFRGTAGDIQMDANGNLTSTVLDFTTLGLQQYQGIWLGGDPTNGTLNFATTAYRGRTYLGTIAAHKLTLLHRAWTIGAADTGVGKTIDIYYGRWVRNVAIDHADFLDPNLGNASYNLELSLPGAAAAGATAYKYASGQVPDEFKITAPPPGALIEASISFMGTTCSDPSTSRATGASAATTPVARQGYNTVDQLLQKPAIYDPNASDAVIAQDINSWGLSLKNNVVPQKQQGTLGAKRLIIGKCEVSVDLECWYVQTDLEAAIGDNRTLRWDVLPRNGDGGMLWEIPSFTLDAGDLKMPANGGVTISPKVSAFRDNTTSYTVACTIFPYLPSS